jgi:uncharacterized membrane protein
MKTLARPQILWMVQTAILTAIIFVMAFTPLGYLKIGPVEITFLTLPVVIGAVIIGPLAGAFLGLIFGITSLIQCFGMSVFGTTLFGISPIFTIILCLVPRVLMGWLVGLIFQALQKPAWSRRLLSFVIASLCGAALNTILFVGGLILFFGQSDYIRSFGPNTWSIIVLLTGINALVEAVVCMVAGGAITKAISVTLRRQPAK